MLTSCSYLTLTFAHVVFLPHRQFSCTWPQEHCAKIITLVGEYCLCQRVKPIGDPKTPFKSEEDFIEALKSHHAVMTCAMKAKQSTDAAAPAALAAAVDNMAKMYLPA